jgi:hypothetical protein
MRVVGLRNPAWAARRYAQADWPGSWAAGQWLGRQAMGTTDTLAPVPMFMGHYHRHNMQRLHLRICVGVMAAAVLLLTQGCAKAADISGPGVRDGSDVDIDDATLAGGSAQMKPWEGCRPLPSCTQTAAP